MSYLEDKWRRQEEEFGLSDPLDDIEFSLDSIRKSQYKIISLLEEISDKLGKLGKRVAKKT